MAFWAALYPLLLKAAASTAVAKGAQAATAKDYTQVTPGEVPVMQQPEDVWAQLEQLLRQKGGR